MNSRKPNIIDNLISKDVDYDSFVLSIVYIFFDFLKLLYDDVAIDILRKYLNNSPNVTTDEIVFGCNISHSTYYRRMGIIVQLIEEVRFRRDELVELMKGLISEIET